MYSRRGVGFRPSGPSKRQVRRNFELTSKEKTTALGQGC